MRKRILSLLLCCVMLIGLLPTAAFAEESTETPPVCICEIGLHGGQHEHGMPCLWSGECHTAELRSIHPC